MAWSQEGDRGRGSFAKERFVFYVSTSLETRLKSWFSTEHLILGFVLRPAKDHAFNALQTSSAAVKPTTFVSSHARYKECDFISTCTFPRFSFYLPLAERSHHPAVCSLLCLQATHVQTPLARLRRWLSVPFPYFYALGNWKRDAIIQRPLTCSGIHHSLR